MKRVGILTFHYINNYGAILQAYALKKAIDKFEGYKAEIINYIPKDRVEYPYENGLMGKRKIEEKLFKLYSFLWDKCEVDKKVVREVSGNEYDYYCVGSDQVWNFDISNNDFTYLLKDVSSSAVKISYASSFGLSVDKLIPYKKIITDCLLQFKHVSVREIIHQKWLNEECEIKCDTVLDPTFLLSGEEYAKLITKKRKIKHPFMLFIWYTHDSRIVRGIEFANTISRKYSLPIVHNLVKPKEWMLANDDGCMFYEGIEDFLWYIKNAEIIVTNSYHVTMFSLHLKKSFYSFVTPSMRSRFDSIGNSFGISDRIVESYIDVDKINMDMKYDNIYSLIEPFRNTSKKYIREALEVYEQ